MALIGILGPAEPDESLVEEGLSDLRDRILAENPDEEMEFAIAVPENPTDALSTVISWVVTEEIPFKIYVHSTIKDKLDDDVTAAAKGVIASKTPDAKVVDAVIKDSSPILLALIGDKAEELTDDLTGLLTKANGAKVVILDLADALAEVGFDDEDDAIDYEALGAAADGGDEEAQGRLTELAEGVIESEEFDSMSWTEVAEKLAEAGASEDGPEPEEEPATKKTTKSSSKATGKFTTEVLASKQLKELREIAAAAGVEGAAKMGRPALTEALLAGGEEAEEPAAEEKPKAPAKGKAAAAKATSDETISFGEIEKISDMLAEKILDALVKRLSS